MPTSASTPPNATSPAEIAIARWKASTDESAVAIAPGDDRTDDRDPEQAGHSRDSVV